MPTAQRLDKKQMIQEIMLVVKVNEVPNADDILLSLAFRTEQELIDICGHLHIKTRI